jgi:hypothetical protein
MKNISAAKVIALRASGQVVFAYPRKGIIVVNGFKRFKASPPAIKAAMTA